LILDFAKGLRSISKSVKGFRSSVFVQTVSKTSKSHQNHKMPKECTAFWSLLTVGSNWSGSAGIE
jgi:hypothetical protein